MDSRRSIGMLKPWAQPKRTSSAASAPGPEPSAPAGGSRLPKLKGPPHRSSSQDLMSARRATSATRSKSPASRNSRTPLQSRHPMTLSGANSASSVRSYAFGGRESMTPNHRESMKVAVKDSRPFNEKSWQQEKVREIIDFCRDAGYPNMLTPSNFPISSTEFRKLFEFLLGFMMPEFVMPRTQDMGTELPVLLKKIGYPGTTSKSMFQTLGTQHSWGSTLAILSYLVMRSRIFLNKMTNVNSIIYQNHGGDEQDAESDRLLFEHWVDCYGSFNNGQDDFSRELEILEDKFMALYGVDDNVDRDLERKYARYKSEYDELRMTSVDMDQLYKEYKEKKEDVQKIKEYCEKNAEHLHKRQGESIAKARVLAELDRVKNALEHSVAELDKFCREEKGVNPDEASSLEYMVNELEQQLALRKKSLEEARSVLWKTEQELGRYNTNIDNTCQQFNLLLMELKIENAKSLRLDRHKSLEDVRYKLNSLMEELRIQEKSLKDSCSRHESDLHSLKQQLNQKLSAVKKNEEELKKRQDEVETFQRKVEAECRELMAAVEDAKEKVAHHSERDKRNLKALNVEMEIAQNELKAIQEERERKVKEGVELIRQVNKFALEERERRAKEREDSLKLYKQKVSETVNAIMEVKSEIQGFADSLPKL